MNNAVHLYVEQHLDKLTGDVLEVGSYDENGSVRDILPNAVGVDMRAGPNVDFVCRAENLADQFGAECFDAVLSIDAFEHMESWRECLIGMWGVLKPGGWLVMTMAVPGKGRHAYPDDYWRADWPMIEAIFPGAGDFLTFGSSMGWTVKKNGPLPDLSNINLIAVP